MSSPIPACAHAQELKQPPGARHPGAGGPALAGLPAGLRVGSEPVARRSNTWYAVQAFSAACRPGGKCRRQWLAR